MDYTFDASGTHDTAPQGSAVWHENRIGKLTASRMMAAMDRLKNGGSSAKRSSMLTELLVERMTNIPVPHYVTPAMQWGRDYEEVAAAAYVLKTDNNIEVCGFFDHPSIDMIGASPDRLVSPDGLLEIKCPTTGTHINWLKCVVCPDDYKPQMILQLQCTGRKWVDFVTFDPRMPPKLQMKIWRFEPTAEEVEKVMNEATAFLAELDQMFDDLEDCAS